MRLLNIFILLMLCMGNFIYAGMDNSSIHIDKVKLETGWAEPHLQKALVKSVSPDLNVSENFKGALPLTRGEFAVMIARVLPCDIEGYTDYTEEYNAVKYYKEQAPSDFSDFKYWDSFGYVERVTKRGIMDPTKGKFNPNEKITRGEFLKTLLILLQKTDDPFARISDIACDAKKLNEHLTGFIDVSVSPDEYPGWVRMAQEYNILPSKNDNDDFLTSRLAIPYKQVFYNYTTRKYEFQPDVPITRELALAIFSNLFVKWDGYGDFIPFDTAIGNTAKDAALKTINGNTKVDCELLNIDTFNNEILVGYQTRKTEFRKGKVFNTVFLPGKQKYKIAENAYIWVILNGKVLKVRGDKPVEKLNTVINKLKDDNIFDIKVNYICLSDEYKYSANKKVVVKDDNTYDKREIIGFLEVNLIPYDYVGRIVAKTESGLTMFDKIKGNTTFSIGKNVKIVREVLGVNGITGILTDKIINESNFDNIKVGEEIKLKLDRDGNVHRVVSRLLRIGVPSNIDVGDGLIKTQYMVGKHYSTVNQQWNPATRTGLSVYNFDYDYPGRWRKGGLDILFSNVTALKKVDIYVQPADAYAVKDDSSSKFENQIFFIEAIPKYF